MLVICLLLLHLQKKLGAWIFLIAMSIVNALNACCKLIRFFLSLRLNLIHLGCFKLCSFLLCIFLTLICFLFSGYEGGFGRKNCCVIHKRWGSAQQPA